MMIELVMYGMIPSEKTENRLSPPPEKRLMKSRNPPELAWFWSTRVSTTGTGMWDPNRYSVMMKRVNRILFRRSGILNELRKAFSTAG